MVKAIVLVKSPKKLIAARLKRVSSVNESFSVSGRFDAVAIIEVNDLAEIKSDKNESKIIKMLKHK